ncbi:MAG: hypothetical protein II798_04625 [Lachnospiraceae bacterium]|nr:hypothetical protein [Lachnospiraceae bacterium]
MKKEWLFMDKASCGERPVGACRGPQGEGKKAKEKTGWKAGLLSENVL